MTKCIVNNIKGNTESNCEYLLPNKSKTQNVKVKLCGNEDMIKK